MRKAPEKNNEMLREYDFSQGVRGKYAQRYARGSNVVVLEPDVAQSGGDHTAAEIASGKIEKRGRPTAATAVFVSERRIATLLQRERGRDTVFAVAAATAATPIMHRSLLRPALAGLRRARTGL